MNKTNVVLHFRKFCHLIHAQYGGEVKILRSDNATECESPYE